MDESRQYPSGAGAVPPNRTPPPVLWGFVLLLALVFTVSYAVGAAAGPVAPGMHHGGTSGRDGDPGRDGGMEDMHGAGG
ncbi:hypothetical protein AB0C59_21055 [Streptomyces sp. NPDC048664]|uniref:hypothetical protein n=1 Tax=Streptomyces sp. NPDC048664 TaxID=3154505 RepID=UPI00344AE1FD